MKTKIKILIGIVIIVVASLLFLYFRKTLPGRLLGFGIEINTGNLKLIDSYQEVNGTNKINWLVADSKDEKLFLGQVDAQNPAKFVSDKLFLLSALYEPSQSPYPEVITNTIDCSDEFKPVKQNFGSGTIYKLYAGERYGYGICTKDLVKYDSLYGLFDCGKKGVFEIKLFGPLGGGDIEKIIKSFTCKN